MNQDSPVDRNVEAALEGVDPSRRKFLRGLLAGSAYAAPLLTSFSLSALSAEPAMAQMSNVS